MKICISHINPTFILVVCLLFLTVKCFSQEVVLKGKVLDDNNAPIELAQVFVEGQLVGTRCNLKGEYELSFQSADTITVAYSMMGYQTRKRKLVSPKDTVGLLGSFCN